MIKHRKLPKKSITLQKKEIEKIPNVENLKIIHTLFGYCQYPGYFLEVPPESPVKNAKLSKIYREVSNMLSYNIDATHFVLGEKNKEFLLKNNVPDDKIVLVDKRAIIKEGHVYNFNKTFLIKCATEVFPGNELFFLDYDCSLQKDFDKEDIYRKFRERKIEIQGPTICYHNKRLEGPDHKKWRSALCTCLFYCSSHDIIREWFKIYSTILPDSLNDEASMLWVLADMFGVSCPEDLYMFDTDVIRTSRRLGSSAYNKDNYKDAYFYHR